MTRTLGGIDVEIKRLRDPIGIGLMNVKTTADLPTLIGDSEFLTELSKRYAKAPSSVLIRTAEVELLHALEMQAPALDLCCGDGFFASLSQPNGYDAGCDISQPALQRAQAKGLYGNLSRADIAQGIPYPDAYFNTVVSNSSLEHVNHIEDAMQEIARVLRPGGNLYFTLASDFAYTWWPCGQDALECYLAYQPVYSYFSLEEWTSRLAQTGLTVVDHRYYLSKSATQLLFFLDYHVSRATMTTDRTFSRMFVRLMQRVPRRALAWLWTKLFASVQIVESNRGGGILIVAERDANG